MKKKSNTSSQRFLLAQGMLTFAAGRKLAIIAGIVMLVLASLMAFIAISANAWSYQVLLNFIIGGFLFVYGYFLLDPDSGTVARVEVTEDHFFIKPSPFKKGNTYRWEDIRALEIKENKVRVHYKTDKTTWASFETRPKEELKQIRVAIRDMAEAHRIRIIREKS